MGQLHLACPSFASKSRRRGSKRALTRARPCGTNKYRLDEEDDIEVLVDNSQVRDSQIARLKHLRRRVITMPWRQLWMPRASARAGEHGLVIANNPEARY